MCHFLLPKRSSSDNSERPNGRYADEAIELFRREVSARGTKVSEYQAKVFGGSNLLRSQNNSSEKSIGLRNAETAMAHLMSAEADILVMHVGEYGHRRVIFDTSNGDAWVKFENSSGDRMQSMIGLT